VVEADLRRPTVALVGFMGAGKSAVGERLAAALGLPFVDTDELIIAEAGPIPEIFADRGEQGFRTLEAQIVTAAIADAVQRPCVLALGGGAVLSGEVRAALRRLPCVVWLAAPADVLWSRVVSGGAHERPLAGDEATFSSLLASREPLYREVATLTRETGRSSVAAVVAEITGTLVSGDADAPGVAAAGPASRPAEGRRR
jgi:shikimate kinase